MIRRLAVATAAALLLIACGADDTGRFDATVDDVRSSVAAGDRAGALAHIDELGMLGMQAHADGDLDEAELRHLGDLLDQARFLVDAEVPGETTTTEAPPPPPEPAATPDDDDGDDGDDDDDDEKKEQGRKNDKKKDDDD